MNTISMIAALSCVATCVFASPPPGKGRPSPAAQERRVFFPDGAVSLVPPAGIIMSPARDGGLQSPSGNGLKLVMNFSPDLETDTRTCNGVDFKAASRSARAYLDAWDACEAALHRGGPVVTISEEASEIAVSENVRLAIRVSRTKPAEALRRLGFDPKNYGSPARRYMGGYLQVGDRIYRVNAEAMDQSGVAVWQKSLRTVRAESAAAPRPEAASGSVPLLR